MPSVTSQALRRPRDPPWVGLHGRESLRWVGMAEAEVRAHWPKFIVRTAKHIRDPKGAAVVDAISPDLRREIREAGRLSWQDASMLTNLAEQIRQGCGAGGAI